MHFYVVIAQYQVVRAVIVHIDVLRFPLCHIKRRGQCHWLVNLRVALAVYGDIHRVLHVAVQVQFVRIRREADGDFVIVVQIGGVIIRLICTVVVVVGDIYQQIGLPLHVLSPVIGIGVGIEHIPAVGTLFAVRIVGIGKAACARIAHDFHFPIAGIRKSHDLRHVVHHFLPYTGNVYLVCDKVLGERHVHHNLCRRPLQVYLNGGVISSRRSPCHPTVHQERFPRIGVRPRHAFSFHPVHLIVRVRQLHQLCHGADSGQVRVLMAVRHDIDVVSCGGELRLPVCTGQHNAVVRAQCGIDVLVQSVIAEEEHIYLFHQVFVQRGVGGNACGSRRGGGHGVSVYGQLQHQPMRILLRKSVCQRVFGAAADGPAQEGEQAEYI